MPTDFLKDFFILNRFIILFLYGQVFFVLGLSIFLQSRRYSRLKLARHLRWLAGFGILHGLHEWGQVFIPLQAAYLSESTIGSLHLIHIILLALSFVCLLKFGLEMLETNRLANLSLIFLSFLWGCILVYAINTQSDTTAWMNLASVWSRYLLGAPGALAASFGLYKFTHETRLVSDQSSYRMLQIAGISLLAYAVFGGMIVPDEPFFPANVFNYTLIETLLGAPVEVYRSLIGLVLAYSMIRAMEIFEIEVDQMIEKMEVSTIQTVERDRIGQEIHDGVLQSVYSASLITGSLSNFAQDNTELANRIEQVRDVLNQAIIELREYMVSLRIPKSKNALKYELNKLINQTRFIGLVDVSLDVLVEDNLSPAQCNHIFGIVQEGLSNIVRHAHAKKAQIIFAPHEEAYQLSILDDGLGFDPQTSTKGYGFQAIHDHTQLLGGELTIESEQNQGTTITIRFGDNS